MISESFGEEETQPKGHMKKLMMVLAIAGLIAGCAHDRGAGGTADQNEMNSGSGANAPKQGAGTGNTYDTNGVTDTNGMNNSNSTQP